MTNPEVLAARRGRERAGHAGRRLWKDGHG
jgi:hypothetical protein